MAYEALASSYDRLTNDIPYASVLAFYDQILAHYGLAPQSALDLACGTGSMALLMARRGWSVLGCDQSEQMLTQAYEKAMDLDNPPYFIRQRMQRLRLPQPVDLVVCCLDGINYVTRPQDVQQTFRRVFEALSPGGVFIFDINSPEKLRGLDGQIFLDEDDDVFCLWRAEFDEKSRICTYGMDIFRRRGRVWDRSREEHLEYAYAPHELTCWLTEAGFADVRVYGDRRMQPPAEGEQRIFLSAQRPNEPENKGEPNV